jgi:hypothetical protein
MSAKLLVLSTMVVSWTGSIVLASDPLQGPYRDHDRLLATRPPHPYGGVDDVRRPGNNGMLWISRGYMGDPEGRFVKEYPAAWGGPGPAAYGAHEYDGQRVHVRVGEQRVVLNPWESIPEEGYTRLEHGRQAWLKERGYTGGVRTFINPVFHRVERSTGMPMAVTAQAKKLPEPRAVFEIPEDMPRFQKRQEVKAEPAKEVKSDMRTAIVVVRTKEEPAVTPKIEGKEVTQVVVREKKKDGEVAVAGKK